MSQCYKHPSKVAVGKCRSCGKYLCDECVAQRKGEEIVCYECAVKVTLDEYDGKEKRDRAVAAVRKQEAVKAANKDSRRRPKPFTLFVILGIIIVFIQAGIVLADYLMRAGTETSVIWSNLMQMRYERDLCAENLHRISTTIGEYRKAHNGSLPPDLAAMGLQDDTVTVCPSSGKPYVYALDGNSYTISCPSPEYHELGFLSSRNGTIVWRR